MLLDLKNNRDLLVKLKNLYDSRNNLYRKMKRYYEGNTDAKYSYETTDRSNRKCSINYIKKFITEEVSFAVGNKTTYISKAGNSDIIKTIEDIFDNQSTNLDISLCTDLLLYGRAYELYYVYDDDFKIKTISPTSGIAYENENGQVELFVCFYNKDLDDTKYLDVIDDEFIYKMDENFKLLEKPMPHYFGKCPVGISKLVNGEHDTVYSEIHELQDVYEKTIWDSCNNIADLRTSYLALYGIDIDEKTALDMKKMGILQIPDASGKAEWLTKDINAEFSKNLIDKLEDLIFQISQHINHNVVLSSNTSGVALSSRLISLRNKVIVVQKCLENCIKQRIRHLFRYLDVYKGIILDYRDINVQFTMNLPQDDLSMAQIISQLSDKLSIQTGLSQLSFITDANKEFEKMLEEQRTIEQNSLETLDNIDTDTQDEDGAADEQ